MAAPGPKGGRSVHVVGVAEVNRVLDRIAREDLKDARGELRKGSQEIAQRHVIPALKRGADTSGVPQAPKLADTMRARADRIVFVKVGGVNPKLSGFRSKTRGRGKNYRTNLALGSNYGPRGGADRNNYSVPRRAGGYWVEPTMKAGSTFATVKREYTDLLNRILAKYGRA